MQFVGLLRFEDVGLFLCNSNVLCVPFWLEAVMIPVRDHEWSQFSSMLVSYQWLYIIFAFFVHIEIK